MPNNRIVQPKPDPIGDSRHSKMNQQYSWFFNNGDPVEVWQREDPTSWLVRRRKVLAALVKAQGRPAQTPQ